ncbi:MULTISPECIES: helix-turn-helix domain containing protein [unclassified Clostridioides]|uniref:helix-turn-helix domain containing protein n=1 Tax=unclassified Clostridioides TaxID=2635829 RepID=UPI001D12AE28|nr:helix-turn-helix domain containing protein [Clostridioides sp. ES-S-0049-03]MCC0678213.1 helix-turn-helix domain containing protein [Clostridioides sp. ES-W-0018-02]MCC0713045.1 helix-turn-helix domain containing protein [Clostridioides sp. ES-W-0017-02]
MSIKYNAKRVVLVDFKNIDKLDNFKIEYIDLEDKQYYVVSQGKRPKKFTDDEVRQIKKDLDDGLSIRKCAEKWNCNTHLIMQIKKDTY